MVSAMSTVREATPQEALQIIESAGATYAADLADAAALTATEAEDRADEQLARLLPEGPATPGMVFLVAERADEIVGGLWLARRGTDGRDLAWIYALHVDPAERGRGAGRLLMTAAHDRARDLGAPAVGLNVFGPNATARHLYDSLGYVVTAQQMQLPL